MTTLTLTPHPTGLPAPFMEILIGSLDAGVATVTLYRTVKGRQMLVRGFYNIAIGGGSFDGPDFEAPFDRAATYQLEQFDSSGNFLSYSTAATATLPGIGKTTGWLHNPFDPTTSVALTMADGAGASIVRPITSQKYPVNGRSAPVAIFGTRGAVTGVVLDCIASTAAAADACDALFGVYDDESTVPILCIRTPDLMRLPSPLFALVGAPQQLPLNFARGGSYSRFALTADEVAAPPESIIIPVLSYADFTAFYPTYAAFTAAYADYQGASSDYSIDGSA